MMNKYGFKELINEIRDKAKICKKRLNDASDDYKALYKYEDEYYLRNLKWAANEMKKKNPKLWNQIVSESKSGGYDPLDSKIVHIQAFEDNDYEKVERYNPPMTKKIRAADKAFDEYYSSCSKYVDNLVGRHKYDVVSKKYQKFNGAYGDTIERLIKSKLPQM